MAFSLFLPLLQGGLAIASGITGYKAERQAAVLARQKDLERQSLALTEYIEEQKARGTEMNIQLTQLNNQALETKEIAESDKGEIALAAEAAKGRALAVQASSGLEAGTGTFGAILSSIGMAEVREKGKVEATVENRMAQIGTERIAVRRSADVPKPFLSSIAPLDTRHLAIGTGLSIASALAGIATKHAPMRR